MGTGSLTVHHRFWPESELRLLPQLLFLAFRSQTMDLPLREHRRYNNHMSKRCRKEGNCNECPVPKDGRCTYEMLRWELPCVMRTTPGEFPGFGELPCVKWYSEYERAHAVNCKKACVKRSVCVCSTCQNTDCQPSDIRCEGVRRHIKMGGCKNRQGFEIELGGAA